MDHNTEEKGKYLKASTPESTATKNMLAIVGHHFRVLFVGLKYMIISMFAVALFTMAIYGFCTIAGENGYAAVGDFIVALVFLVLAVANLYVLGCPKKSKSEKRKGK